MKTLKKILLWLWQMPQNLIGLFMVIFLIGKTKQSMVHWKGTNVESIRFWLAPGLPGGVTLGEYIFLYTDNANSVLHEYGHVKQSRILGPLFLFVIGIPSIIHAAIGDHVGCDNTEEGYYHFYTERWANKLVGLPIRKDI